MILFGYLNEDLLNPNFHNLKDLVLIKSMINVITEPTRQHAILDPIIIPEDFPILVVLMSLITSATIKQHILNYPFITILKVHIID